MISNIEDEHT